MDGVTFLDGSIIPLLLGMQHTWDELLRRLTVTDDTNMVIFSVNSPFVVVRGGEAVLMEANAFLLEDNVVVVPASVWELLPFEMDISVSGATVLLTIHF